MTCALKAGVVKLRPGEPCGACASQRRGTGALTGIAKPPYVFYATLPNEGILMVEALERRPWWKKGEKVRAS